MAQPVQFTKEQTDQNRDSLSAWAEKHNRNNEHTVAHFEELSNGNMRVWVQKKDSPSRWIIPSLPWKPDTGE